MKKWGLILLLCSMLACCAAAGEGAAGILYKIEGGKNPMMLLGSIHIGLEEMQPFGERLTQAIAQADSFGFECDTSSPLSALLIAKEARYGAGDSLRCHVSDSTISLVEKLAQQLGYNSRTMLSYKPWALMNLLLPQTVSLILEGTDGNEAVQKGVDLLVAALAENRDRVYLETIQEQLSSMNSLSDSLSEEMLRETLLFLLGEEEAQGVDADMRHWGLWWRDGDAQAFAASYRNTQGAEADEEYKRIMLTERNDRMAQRLMALLENEEAHSYLVTVGLMHLVMEEDSILTRLQEAGYTVTQLK